jgi:hypothetical protein
MSDSLSMGWAEADAARRLRSFRRVYLATLLVQALLGLAVILAPRLGGRLTGIDVPEWDPVLTLWAATLVALAAVQLPAWHNPVKFRFVVGVAAAAHLWLALVLVFLGTPFLRLALLHALFGVGLLLLFQRALLAHLQSRP